MGNVCGNCNESSFQQTDLQTIPAKPTPSLYAYQNVISIENSIITSYHMQDGNTSQHTILDCFSGGYSLITYKQAVFIAGGIQNPKRAWMWESNQLYTLSDLKTVHIMHTTAIIQEQVIIISGKGNQNCESLALGHNILTSNWDDFGILQEARYNATAATLDEKIYLIGGLTNGDVYAKHVDIWDSKWLTAQIKCNVHSACSVVQYGQILICGGTSEDEEFVQDVWILDPEEEIMENSGQQGVAGLFSGYTMYLSSPAGVVFTNDGELVMFDELSSTFSKMPVAHENIEGKDTNKAVLVDEEEDLDDKESSRLK